jgi:hypothetical protein
MAELLWSDPQTFQGRAPSKRGVGVAFGPDVTDRFLKANNLCMYLSVMGEGGRNNGKINKNNNNKYKNNNNKFKNSHMG